MIFLTLEKVEVQGNVPLTNCLAKLRFLVYTKYIRDPEIKALLRQEAEKELKDRLSHESFLKAIEDALEDRSQWPSNDGAKNFKPAGRPRTEDNTETSITLSQRASWYTSSRDRTRPVSIDPPRSMGMSGIGSGSGPGSGMVLRYDTHTSENKQSSSRYTGSASRLTALQAVEENAPGEPRIRNSDVRRRSSWSRPWGIEPRDCLPVKVEVTCQSKRCRACHCVWICQLCPNVKADVKERSTQYVTSAS